MLQFPRAQMKSIVSYVSEVRTELQKVVWPKRRDVIELTLTVIIVSTLIALYVGGLDYGFAQALTYILSR